MNYLRFIERSAENLQFYLWFRDYSARFDKLPESEKVLSPEWTKAQAEAAGNGSSNRHSTRAPPEVAAALKDTDFADGKPKAISDKADPFHTPDKTPSLEEKRDMMSEYGSSHGEQNTMSSGTAHQSVAESAFDDAGLKWKPCAYLLC